MSKINIIFEEKTEWFLPGDSIIGKVIVTAKKDIKCKELNVTFHGFCFVNFKGAKTVSEGNDVDSTKEDYYISIRPLIQDSKLLSVGEHTFNFRYRLPQNIPPSYESQWGFIRHYAEAVLETQSLLKPNFKCSEMITVVSTGLDLRKYPDSVKPEVVTLEKDVKQLNGSAGKLEVTVWINKTAFVPGENVIVNTIINNNTSKQLLSAKATIIEAKIYKVASRNFTKPTIISSKVKKYLSTTTSFNWINENLLVPEVHLTRLKGCSLIDLRYSFHFEVILKTPAQLPELQTYIPILLGTVPLKSTENIGGEIKIKQSYNAPLTTTPYTLEPPKVTIQMGHNQASNAPLTPTPYPLEPSKVTTHMGQTQASNAPLTPPPYTLEPPNVTPLFGFNGLDQMGQNQGMASVPVCNTVAPPSYEECVEENHVKL